MTSWKDDKNLGPWTFHPQPDKWGYLNNKRWTNRRNAIAFSEDVGNPIDVENQHIPCGHWHKGPIEESGYINIGSSWWWQPFSSSYSFI